MCCERSSQIIFFNYSDFESWCADEARKCIRIDLWASDVPQTNVLFRGVLGMQLEEIPINCQTHPVMNGESPKQANAFDCGIFALANVEKYISQPTFPPVTQSLMKLYRCRYLNKLFSLARDIDIRIWLNETIDIILNQNLKLHSYFLNSWSDDP